MSSVGPDVRDWLISHINLELGSVGVSPGRDRIANPTLERIERLGAYLGSPEADLDGIHITGTNGKTSVTRIATAILLASGRSTGTYTSPHLVRVNERIARNGDPIADVELDSVLETVRIAEAVAFTPEVALPSYFELLTAAAFRYFSDEAVEAAVIEVGMGGSWDATNVFDGQVAVITNVAIDHVAFLGTTRGQIAEEKSGIIKEGATVVLGEGDEELCSIVARRNPGATLIRGRDFSVLESSLAHGGRAMSLEIGGRRFEDLHLPLHGAHQVDNAVIAIAACEAFIGEPLDEDVVRSALAAVTTPGRLEVLGRQPLVLLDGAHNVAGMTTLRAALDESFGQRQRTLVLGILSEKDPEAMLQAIGLEGCDTLVCVTPPSPRALPATELAALARRIGPPSLSVLVAEHPEDAIRIARSETPEDGEIVVCGSLYLAGAVRAMLAR